MSNLYALKDLYTSTPWDGLRPGFHICGGGVWGLHIVFHQGWSVRQSGMHWWHRLWHLTHLTHFFDAS